VAVVALPVRAAEIVPAEKLPEPSRVTIAEFVFALVAVVAELETLPEVAIVANFVSTIPAAASTPAFTNPVAFVNTRAEGVPSAGVTNVGELANTSAPLPVSSEITPANSLDDVAARTDNLSVVTTSVLDDGIVVLLIEVAVATPRAGVVNVGDACITNTEPVPVCAATLVVLPEEVIGPLKFALVVTVEAVVAVAAFPPILRAVAVPVRLVATPEAGVPRTGAVITGLVRVLFTNVSAKAIVAKLEVVVGSVIVAEPLTSVTAMFPERVLLVRVAV
jgi:hypothetical protein